MTKGILWKDHTAFPAALEYSRNAGSLRRKTRSTVSAFFREAGKLVMDEPKKALRFGRLCRGFPLLQPAPDHLCEETTRSNSSRTEPWPASQRSSVAGIPMRRYRGSHPGRFVDEGTHPSSRGITNRYLLWLTASTKHPAYMRTSWLACKWSSTYVGNKCSLSKASNLSTS